MSIRTFLAIIAVFAGWSAIDFLVHGIVLQQAYAATSELWRLLEEMKMTLMYGVTLAAAACFVLVYSCLVQPKSIAMGVKLGLLFGLASGVSVGFGFYSFMPIPLSMAQAWFAAALAQGLLAGVLVGAIVTPGQDVIN